MHQTASIEMSGGKTEANRLRLRLSPDGRTIIICIAAFVSGFIAWSGKPSLNYLALLYPFIYLHSQRRLDASSSLIYYASATWSVIPGTMNFFNTKGNPTLPLLIWLMLISLSSAPWIAFYHRRFLPSSAVAAIISLAIPFDQSFHRCPSPNIGRAVVSRNTLVGTLLSHGLDPSLSSSWHAVHHRDPRRQLLSHAYSLPSAVSRSSHCGRQHSVWRSGTARPIRSNLTSTRA